jgi:hypothetical protein
VPDPWSGFIVYVADGQWNPADPNFVAPTLEDVQRERWGLDDAGIAQFEQDATAFFVARFGIDIADPANAERLLITRFGCDPRIGYRVVMMADHVVPPEGWPMCDAGINVTVLDPAGFELGGELAGLSAPAGASMAYGRYQFETERGETIDVAFRAIAPYVNDPYGAAVIRCEIDSPQLGSGEAHLAYKFEQTPAGEFAVLIRNVLTFD